MRHTAAEFSEHCSVCFQRPRDEVSRETRVALSIEVFPRSDGCDGAAEIQLACLMAAIKLVDHRIILIEIGFRAAQGSMVRRHQRAVEPFVGMEQRRQHAVSIRAVKYRLSGLRTSLA